MPDIAGAGEEIMAAQVRIVRLAAWLLLFVAGAASPGSTLGQRTARSLLTYQGGIGLSATTVREEAAAAGDFPAHGFGVQLHFTPRLNEVFALRAEAGLTFLGSLCFNEDADCSRERDTESRKEPGFLMLSGSLGAGLLSPPFQLGSDADGLRLALGLYGGREWVNAWRGIRDCVNCFEEDLRLQGGFFAEPALELSFFPGLGLGVYYRAYHQRADLRGRVTVRLIASEC